MDRVKKPTVSSELNQSMIATSKREEGAPHYADTGMTPARLWIPPSWSKREHASGRRRHADATESYTLSHQLFSNSDNKSAILITNYPSQQQSQPNHTTPSQPHYPHCSGKETGIRHPSD